MKRHYISLWLLLLSAFVIFAVLSAFDMPEVGGYTPRSSGIADALFASRPAETTLADSVVADTGALAVTDSFPMPIDTAAQTILLIGDSMLDGISPRLAAYAEHNGHTLYTVIWYSSTSQVWGSSTRLKEYIGRLNPTFIVICLGANELFVRDIEAKREKYVRKIIEDIGNIPFVWIGPPNWRDDTGINGLIARMVPRGSFFLSNGMTFERGRDGAHPTHASAALWVDSVARWMPANAAHPIRLDTPQKSSGRARRTFVHQPTDK